VISRFAMRRRLRLPQSRVFDVPPYRALNQAKIALSGAIVTAWRVEYGVRKRY
jgi:hypothetical protein